MICEGLRTLLLAQSSVTDTTSEIYVTQAPQRAGTPRIVVDRVSDEKYKGLDGYQSAKHCEVDIEVWSTTPTKAAALAKTISDFLDDYTGAAGNETILSSHQIDTSDSFDYRSSGDDVVDYVTILNFEFHYTE